MPDQETTVDHRTAEIARAIRLERQRQQLTQQELGDSIGRSAGHVSRVELGAQRPSLKTLILMAEALGVTFAYLVTPVDDPERERIREPWKVRQAQWLEVSRVVPGDERVDRFSES